MGRPPKHDQYNPFELATEPETSTKKVPTGQTRKLSREVLNIDAVERLHFGGYTGRVFVYHRRGCKDEVMENVEEIFEAHNANINVESEEGSSSIEVEITPPEREPPTVDRDEEPVELKTGFA